jgi:hypothetical protein
MFPKGIVTGFFEFHPLAMVLKWRAAAGLKTASSVLTSNVGKAKFLNIITIVPFLQIRRVRAARAINLQMINGLKTRQLWVDEQ